LIQREDAMFAYLLIQRQANEREREREREGSKLSCVRRGNQRCLTTPMKLLPVAAAAYCRATDSIKSNPPTIRNVISIFL